MEDLRSMKLNIKPKVVVILFKRVLKILVLMDNCWVYCPIANVMVPKMSY